ncbi:hypothetical protein [Robertkochia solimangrovi]|uniref:hypothetical protein n=1 Tax=Robertkochia solimangrovi TaxID=2213046 RepID=UPI001181216A|nr:hypothetical protein [Robertkochia solimangrovi]TRZ41961.1 hypothetical protein DMZ48_15090 [Robertkochia solimangrovi]
MRKLIIVYTLLFLSVSHSAGQTRSSDLLNLMPAESIFLHLNTSLLFSGEQLDFKIYCLNNLSENLSDLSKVAHIFLIGKNDKIIISRKIMLNNGTGQGDLIIPADLQTGSYKLYCFTNWMKNGSSENYFQSDLRIINPYFPLPVENLQTNDKDSTPIQVEDITAETSKYAIPLQVSLDQKEVGKRQQVTIDFSVADASVLQGNYSLSVRSFAPIESPENSIISFQKAFVNRPDHYSNITTNNNLPEIRGRLISGKLRQKNDGTPAVRQKIALSILNEDPLFQIATTDGNGQFYFNIERTTGNVNGFFQLIDDNWLNLELVMDEDQSSFGKISFPEFKITEKLHDYILQRSIHNQIERSYAAIKEDSILKDGQLNPFKIALPTRYVLDDFTRFRTIEETMIEVIERVFVIKKSGKRVFQVRQELGYDNPELVPLVLVDGLYLKDHESFMDYGANKIKAISFSRKQFLYGSEYFQGILSFETIDGNFSEEYNSSEIQELTVATAEPAKVYFDQEYSASTDDKSSRIPDFRNQLLWLPEIDLQTQKDKSFFTSDIIGTFEVVLKGFTAEGAPVEIRKYFTVSE